MRLTRASLLIARSHLDIGIMGSVLILYADFWQPHAGCSVVERSRVGGAPLFLVVVNYSSARGCRGSTAFFQLFWFELIVGLGSAFANDIRLLLRKRSAADTTLREQVLPVTRL